MNETTKKHSLTSPSDLSPLAIERLNEGVDIFMKCKADCDGWTPPAWVKVRMDLPLLNLVLLASKRVAEDGFNRISLGDTGVIATVVITACSGSTGDKFVGKWINRGNPTITLEIEKDSGGKTFTITDRMTWMGKPDVSVYTATPEDENLMMKTPVHRQERCPASVHGPRLSQLWAVGPGQVSIQLPVTAICAALHWPRSQSLTPLRPRPRMRAIFFRGGDHHLQVPRGTPYPARPCSKTS